MSSMEAMIFIVAAVCRPPQRGILGVKQQERSL
jgi:hypothetical protein